MNFSEATELLLASLYESDKQSPETQIDAGALAKTLDLGDDTVIKDAVWALDERGLVAAVFAAGSPQCAITAVGRTLVETGGSTGIIRKFQADPRQYIKVSSPPPPPAIAGAQALTPPPPPTPAAPAQPAKPLDHQAITEKLTATRRLLQRDLDISEPEKIDAVCDVDTLIAHLGRQKPERFIVEPLLARLGAIASVADAIRQFAPLVKDSF